jgi:tol-pal system protein YbgF
MDAKSEKLFKGGLLFLKDKNYTKASEIFRRYQANYPVGAHASESMYLRGQIALALGKPQVAESRFKELLRVYPKSKKAPDTYLNLALIAKAMGKKKELNNYIKIINKRYPKSSAYKKSLQLKT